MIKAISHIGVAVRDLEASRAFYRKVFGLESGEPIVGGGGTVRVSMIHLSNAVVELLEPVGTEGPVAKFLEKSGEGIHHVCYEVDDIRAEIEELKGRGLQPLGEVREGAEGLTIFFHPKATHGVLTELVQKR